MAILEKPASGELKVGLAADGKNVILGCGRIELSLSADQDENLALMLWKKTNIIRGLLCGHRGDQITQDGGWATAQFSYCFKEECQKEFYAEAQGMIHTVNPDLAAKLSEATKTKTFTCPKCGAVSYNPNDVREGYCGACHEFTGVKA